MVVKFDKNECAEEFARLYALNESFQESEVVTNHPTLYASAVQLYGSWKNALNKHGIRRQKLVEREKFILYWMMKRRFELYGDESIRHINIQPQELKDRVTNAFKTVKALRRHFYSWNEEKVLFELRMHLLTGGTIERMRTEYPELYRSCKPFFKNIDELKESYEDAFGIIMPEEESNKQANEEERSEPEKAPVQVSEPENSRVEDILIDFLKELEYFKDMGSKSDIIEHIVGAKNISKNEVIDFLFDQWSKARKEGKTVREEDIKVENPVMYYAFKQYFSNLREAFQELISKVQ